MDINIILQIARYWWDVENHPYPAKKTLADSIGVTPRTIQKHIADMEKAGFIERVERREAKGSKTNIYRLSPLNKLLEPFSKDIITQRKQEDKKRPNLRGNLKKTL